MDQSAKPVILIVEDEPLILIHSRLALEDAGYDILPANDAAEALDHLSARDDIHAVFTDVRLPGHIDGIALARRVSEERPGIAIVVTSGATPVDGARLPPMGQFVAKPYTAAQITRAIDAAT